VINITTTVTMVSNVRLDDNIRIRLLEEEGFKLAPELENVGAEDVDHSRSEVQKR